MNIVERKSILINEIEECKKEITRLQHYIIKAEGAIEILTQQIEEQAKLSRENENITDNRRNEGEQKQDKEDTGSEASSPS